MKLIIYITGEEVSTIWRGEEYLVDGQPAAVEAPLHLLTDVDRPAGSINTATHRLQFVPAYVGYLFEVFFFSTALSDTNRDDLINYLQGIWGL